MKLNTKYSEYWLKKKHTNLYRQPTIKRNNISRIFIESNTKVEKHAAPMAPHFRTRVKKEEKKG